LETLSGRVKRGGGLLYLDLPLGLHPDAYDTWQYPDFFVKGMSGGAPPDIVFTTGQNWGLPPMHPHRMRENRHRYTIGYIRNHLKYAGMLRIDHVMGLHRFFWIPDGMPVSEGVYVEYPAEELYAILSVESHCSAAGIVGENLGNVAPIVTKSMRRHNIHEMYVAQYRLSDNSKRNTLGTAPPDAVASLNTHDMPPYRAFLDGLDIPDKLALGFVKKAAAAGEARLRATMKKRLGAALGAKNGDAKEILRQSLLFLGRSRAGVVLVNLEDLWQEVLPQNTPATSSSERPNWRRRLRYSIERIKKDRDIAQLLQQLNKVRNSAK
jgi:4-alpha-glucanotransferase